MTPCELAVMAYRSYRGGAFHVRHFRIGNRWGYSACPWLGYLSAPWQVVGVMLGVFEISRSAIMRSHYGRKAGFAWVLG